jgi:hypothetical protein
MQIRRSLLGLGLFTSMGVLAWSAPLPITISSASGYLISWDGNDGAHFSQAVPNNLALASNGATAISSGQLGPELSLGYHLTSNINDGLYGNDKSWIGGSSDSAPFYAGVLLSQTSAISSVAFGRDNGGDVTAYQDRFAGTYTLQFTTDGVAWIDIGVISLAAGNEDFVQGSGYTGYLRHEFVVSTAASAPIEASGFRVLVSLSGISTGLAIDELEVYGTPIPEPSTTALLVGGAAVAFGLLRRRRR